MALHGTIYVNASTIGRWSAERKDPTAAGLCWYVCSVEWFDERGHDHRITFEVSHFYTNGALALASIVLSEANHIINERKDHDSSARR